MSQPNLDKVREEYLAAMAEMYDELQCWREKHPGASIDEIAGQITPRRREIIGQLMKQLAWQHGDGEVIEGLPCPDCGGAMIYKGRPKREVVHLEGETGLERAYYITVPNVRMGFFPLDERLRLGEHCWTPETVKQMMKLGAEIRLLSTGGGEF